LTWIEDKRARHETVFEKNTLKLHHLNHAQLKAYECLAEYESGKTKAVLMLEKNNLGTIDSYLKNYLILPLHSKHSFDDAWPALVLDFKKSIEQIPVNSMVEILCTSSPQGKKALTIPNTLSKN
jgi:hypothetical protein